MRRPLVHFLSALLICLLCGVSWAATGSRTLSILPFEDLTGTEETSLLMRRLPVELPVKLQRANRSLNLVSRDPEIMEKVIKELSFGSSGFADPQKAPALGKLHGVQAFVGGVIDKQGEQYRCLLQIVDTTTGLIQSGETTAADLESLPNAIAEEVLRVLGLPVTNVERAALQAPGLSTFIRAFKLEQRGDLQDAALAYQQATELEPGFPEAWNNLAGIYRKQGKTDQALQAYRQALAIAPHQAILHANLGNLYFDGNRYDQALQAYSHALELDRALPKVHYNVACIHALQGRKKQALASLEQAFLLLPDLKKQARQDPDLASLRNDKQFQRLTAVR